MAYVAAIFLQHGIVMQVTEDMVARIGRHLFETFSTMSIDPEEENSAGDAVVDDVAST